MQFFLVSHGEFLRPEAVDPATFNGYSQSFFIDLLLA
jgi:hypothetical protein